MQGVPDGLVRYPSFRAGRTSRKRFVCQTLVWVQARPTVGSDLGPTRPSHTRNASDVPLLGQVLFIPADPPNRQVNAASGAAKYHFVHDALSTKQSCEFFEVREPATGRAERVNEHDCMWGAKALGFEN